MSDGLPDPKADPVSPLFAHMMNSIVRGAGNAIGKGVELVQEAPGAIANATASVAQKGADIGSLVDKDTAPKGETIKEQKELQRGLAQETTITAENKPALDSSLGKGASKEEGQDASKAVASGHFVGTQAVAMSGIEDLGKPIAVGVQTQSQGLGL